MNKRFVLDEGEKLVIAIDDHWMSMLPPVLLFVMGIGFSYVILLFSHYILGSSESAALISYLFSGAVILATLHWFFIYLFEWELSTWIVTTKRVIDVRFFPYVKHNVRYTMIKEIHEVEKHKEGLVKNIFDYGDIKINLAAITQSMEFKYVPRPGAFANMIQTIHKSDRPQDLDVEALRAHYYA